MRARQERWWAGLAAAALVVLGAASGPVAPASGAPAGGAAPSALAAVLPIVSVAPNPQAAGGALVLSGGRFDPWTSVELLFDGTPFASGFVLPDGTFALRSDVPDEASPGSHTITVEGMVQGGDVAPSATLSVTTGPPSAPPPLTRPDAASFHPVRTCRAGTPTYTPGSTVQHLLVTGSPSTAFSVSVKGRAGVIGGGQLDVGGAWTGSIDLPVDAPVGNVTLLVQGEHVGTVPLEVAIPVSPLGTPVPAVGPEASWFAGGAVVGAADGLATVTAAASSVTLTAAPGHYVVGGTVTTTSSAGPPVRSSFVNPNPDTSPNHTVAFTGTLAQVDVTTCEGTAPAPDGGGLTGVSPARLLDTRVAGQGPCVGAGATRNVTVRGVGGVPASGVGAVVVNVTATQPTRSGFMTVWPKGQAVPTASNLNFAAGQTIPNLVIAKVGADGQISVFNAAGCTHVIVDVMGWFKDGAPGAGGLTGVSPARLLDTRVAGQGPCVGAGATRNVTVRGVGGVPASGVGAVVVNVTATQPTRSGFMTVWPKGQAVPTASNLNFAAGQTIPNLVIAKVGADGQISVFNAAGCTHVIVDVMGWFKDGAPGAGGLTGVSPARLLDTRVAGQGPCVGAGATRNVTVRGVGGVPASGVGAVVVNVTATQPTRSGFMTVWPKGQAVPTASNLNFAAGQTIPNLVIAKVGADGQISVFNAAGCTHVIVDVMGWFKA